MNRVGERELPVALVGAGLLPLPRLLRIAKPYAERMFAYHQLDRLSEAEARTALVAPAGQHDVAFEPGAVQPIVKESAGYPPFHPGVRAGALERGGAFADHRPGRRRRASAHRRGSRLPLLQGPLEMASDAEQRYLAAMAEVGDGAVRTAEVASRAGYKDSAGASVVRNALLRKDLVYSPRRGLIDSRCHSLVATYGGSIRFRASTTNNRRTLL